MDPLAFLESVAGHTQARYPTRTPRLGTVDPAYTTGDPKITFDGETSLSGKTYPYAGYTPQAGDRVVLLPVGNSWLIVGAVGVLDGRGKAASVHTHAESDVTSLVTDLAGKVDKATLTAKGDLYVATAVSTPARLGVGANDAVLMADSSQSAGVRWDTGGHEASYTAGSTQTIATATDTPMSFASSDYTTSDVTRGTATGSIANAKFTLNRTGLWLIEAGARTDVTTSGKSYGIWLGPDGGTTRYAGDFKNNGGTDPMEFSITCCRRFTSGAALNVNFWHNQGTNHTTQLLNGINHVRLAWLHS